LPVAAPLMFDGESLHRIATHRFALFECWPGTAPELDTAGHRAMLGRALGRMHALGATRAFQYRSTVRDWRGGNRARDAILNLGIVPAPVDVRYAQVSEQLTAAVALREPDFAAARTLRLHGDCHPGNILWNVRGPLFVDFDDCLSGPAVQDLWMLSAGTAAQQQQEWAQLMEGYERFAHFDFAEVALIESLRAIRMLNHAAWLATRWADPAFPRAFPWFAEARFWERHVAELQEQLEAVEDPPLLRATW
jgi:Ser/Thr protein kinase RdoA (MazF antagonist)